MSDQKNDIQFDDLIEDVDISTQELAEMGGSKMVYIRPVQAGDVSEDLMDDDGYLTYDLPDETILYSVHAADGERIALVGDLDLAFAASKQQGMNPVNVH